MGIVWEVETYMLSGRSTEAEAHARQGLEAFVDRKQRGSEAWLRFLLAELQARRDSDQLIAAQSSMRQALSLARDLGMRPLQAHCHFGLGRIHAKTESRDLARSDFNHARELYDAMSMPFWLAKLDLALASLS